MAFPSFRNHRGLWAHPLEVVVPVLEQTDDDSARIRGTAFFVQPQGIFLTAAHVVDDFESTTSFLMLPQFIPATHKYIRRFIVQVFCHGKTDIAAGLALPLPASNDDDTIRTRAMAVTTTLPQVGELVHYYGYPNSRIAPGVRSGEFEVDILPGWSQGMVEDILHGRDAVMQPGCCIQTSLDTDPGASGGPVMDSRGRVFAVISSGLESGLTYIAPIADILDLPVGSPDAVAGNLGDFLVVDS
jgi:trypsin-like peptidase